MVRISLASLVQEQTNPDESKGLSSREEDHSPHHAASQPQHGSAEPV